MKDELNILLIFLFSISTIAFFSAVHNIDLVHNADLLKTDTDCNVFSCMDLEELYKKSFMYVFFYPLIVITLVLMERFIKI